MLIPVLLISYFLFRFLYSIFFSVFRFVDFFPSLCILFFPTNRHHPLLPSSFIRFSGFRVLIFVVCIRGKNEGEILGRAGWNAWNVGRIEGLVGVIGPGGRGGGYFDLYPFVCYRPMLASNLFC